MNGASITLFVAFTDALVEQYGDKITTAEWLNEATTKIGQLEQAYKKFPPTQTLLSQSLDSERLTRGFQEPSGSQIAVATSESPIIVNLNSSGGE